MIFAGRAAAITILAVTIGIFLSFGLTDDPTGTYALSSSTNTYDMMASPSSPITLTERIYIPFIAKNYCPPVTIPPEAMLSGVVYWDYNGDGRQQPNEPGISGIRLAVEDQTALSQCNGVYYFTHLPGDALHRHISVNSAASFRYFTPNIYQEIPIAHGLDVVVGADRTASVPLAEGPYRSPFRGVLEIEVGTWKDLDLRTCWGPFPDRSCEYRLDWLGGQNTYDGHDGTDFRQLDPRLNIYAMRSGVVIEAHPIRDEGYAVLIRDSNAHEDIGYSYQSFVHLATLNVSVGQMVNPDTVLGIGGAEKIGRTVHVNQYIHVPPDKHPADMDFRINPYVPCPFSMRLWTGFGAVAERILERTQDGSLRQVYP